MGRDGQLYPSSAVVGALGSCTEENVTVVSDPNEPKCNVPELSLHIGAELSQFRIGEEVSAAATLAAGYQSDQDGWGAYETETSSAVLQSDQSELAEWNIIAHGIAKCRPWIDGTKSQLNREEVINGSVRPECVDRRQAMEPGAAIEAKSSSSEGATNRISELPQKKSWTQQNLEALS
uniref:Uncharacterized protein n=1 Tax=Ditylenchus dipsaci TaxID=166011 RepID=A0A915CYI5_9BILA